MKKSCELCKFPARLYCESDQASLCWDCDAKVHFANFLVARHSRSLLCHVCQSPTAWTACGSKLGKTISVCETCADGGGRREEEESEGDNVDETDTEDEYEDEDEDEEDDDDDEEDGENQVVPWSSTMQPPAASCSSSEESSCRFNNGDRDVSSKRMRENDSDLHSNDDDEGSSSSRRNSPSSEAAVEAAVSGGEGAAAFAETTRPMKSRRIEQNESGRVGQASVGSTAAIVESLKKFGQQDATSSDKVPAAAIAGICELSKSPRAVDFDYSESS
ncbi:uncharacterized protein LOC132307315 [Cornus florida]|uniref:uncharacterized protein LOC132307315 n=1 Tax=Cornus florida TaxID=4283 RepID=UPI002898F187|nr:uncharacterized protein LOC132307315 [Cornus florida]